MSHNTCPLPENQVTLMIRHLQSKGGLEKSAWRIAHGFMRKGIPVNFLTTDETLEYEKHPLLSIHSLPLKKWGNYRRMEEFDHLCTEWTYTHPTNIIFGMDHTSRQTHIRAGNGVHAAYQERRLQYEPGYSRLKAKLNPLNHTILNIQKAAFENPELRMLFTNSHMVKNEVLEFYKTPAEKIAVIHNGVDWKLLSRDFEAWTLKKPDQSIRLGLDPTDYHFLFVGNGYKRKGLPQLLVALQAMSPSNVHLSVVGKEKKIGDFQALVKKLDLEKKVTFFGTQKEMTPFYQVADALVVPSLYDPFANVTVEALAMGLYVVSSEHNGGCEVLKEDTGCVIPNLLDPEAFAESLMHAVARPKTWVRSLAIRDSVKHLDYSNKLSELIQLTLSS